MLVLILEIFIFGIRWISALEYSGLWPFFLQICRQGNRVRDQIKFIWQDTSEPLSNSFIFLKSLSSPKSLKSFELPNSLKSPKSLKSLNTELTEIIDISETIEIIELTKINESTEISHIIGITHNTRILVIRHNKLERRGSLKHSVGLGYPILSCDNVFCYPQWSAADPLLYSYELHNSLCLHLALFILILCSSVLFCNTPRKTEHHHSTFQVTTWCLYCFLLYCRGQDFILHHCTIQLTRLYYSKLLNQLFLFLVMASLSLWWYTESSVKNMMGAM